MSTFDGYVKEFPTIRIDYFRTHSDKPPPAACFLSHVHSDHLVGLESLKMPFVYCSSTTRRLLLRMEKYPHRINFAKGILESRKQHYRHLKLVLRALPLQTATELELGPKSKIRVTLIDANHCPGSVMFLIEDDGNAILYTGDVRAEPWWVNAIIQNPFLLPYAFGQKRLNCMYLDTTFSTHDQKYRDFPTKADGLKELLEKVANFPEETAFYFRAWTLGYEQVWIALSNLLRCQVHVDEYQISLFAGIVENGRDGYGTFEGPALAGFPVGNQRHQGCLSQQTDTRLHSCEPGSACHTALKKKNVVWITPIISRLNDGTELLELGAGGGSGDLYQRSELELNDTATLEVFMKICGDTIKDQEVLKKLDQLTKRMRQSGSLKLSLQGLSLDAKEEVSLKEFIQLLSSREVIPENGFKDSSNESNVSKQPKMKDRIVHFPFSRHSSYQELRNFVSVFLPRDICPCTVDVDGWTEDVSMQSLFGDLCSETTFYHDTEIKAEVEGVRRAEQIKNSLKRKRLDESQGTDNDGGDSLQEVFTSARESVGSGSRRAKNRPSPSAKSVRTEDSSLDQRPLLAPDAVRSGPAFDKARQRSPAKVQDIMAEFHALNNGKDLITKDGIQEATSTHPSEDATDSQQSISLSEFESQNWLPNDDEQPPQFDGGNETGSIQEGGMSENKRSRLASRKDAYTAANSSIGDGENGHWRDLNLRSVGRRGHSDVELEL
jgi:DNA cross-link repair 1C protein